jgi:hypothetical protein
MTSLNDLGFPVNVPLEEDHEIVPGTGPIFVLSREYHLSSPGIAKAVLNAARLIDKSVVALVAVEQFFAGDVREAVTEKLKQEGNGSIEEYSASLLAEFGSDEEIARRIAQNPPVQSFARHLLCLRPNANVICVEDAVLYEEANKYSRAAAKQHSDEPDQAKREALQLEWRRTHSLQVDMQRDDEYVRRSDKVIKDRSMTGAILLNVGGMHINRIAERLRREGRGFLLLNNGVKK